MSTWYRRRDSNPHCLVSKTSASSPLGYAGMILSEVPISELPKGREAIRTFDIRTSAMSVVDLARFERATSTFAESRSDPLSYRSRFDSGGERAALTAHQCCRSIVIASKSLAEAAGVEPAHATRGDLANRCHTVRRRLRRMRLELQTVSTSGGR